MNNLSLFRRMNVLKLRAKDSVTTKYAVRITF